jgi:dTDP-4-amino-4,6-dideoxygalactose transaminase
MGIASEDLRLPELAIFGAPAAFDEKLHVGRPNIGNRDRFLERTKDILDSRWLSNHGKYVAQLESRICQLLGVAHCILVCNATVGLELLIRAVGMRGEVIVPAFTFVATAHALQWQEITPVFADADPVTHCIDPQSVERMLTPRTTGIMGVHLWGQTCAIDALQSIAQRHHLSLIFDAAHAFGCSHGGRMVGSFGSAEVFSFHATKFINAFEGGAIVTNDKVLAAKLRLMQNFGFSGYDNVVYLGTNGKMSEISAAMGLTNVESMDEIIAHNLANYLAYRKHLQNTPGLRILQIDEGEKRNFQYIVVEVDEQAGLSRDALLEVLHAENVIARRYFFPGVHRMEPYRSYFPHANLLLPNTEALCRKVLVLPTGTAISVADVKRICAIVEVALGNATSVRQRLSAMSNEGR